MTRVLLPTVLRKHAAGNRMVDVNGATVAEAIEQLTAQHPSLQAHLWESDGETLLRFVNVFVNDQNIRDLDGLATVVDDRDELVIVPALAGG